ncbi:MAG: TOBE domain-containing protein, partial [Chloroflexota bacterium]|nr:TOBE domain-containing protein [Chloroflexota bacterium]
PEEVYYKPKTKFVAQFLGRTNLFHADAKGDTEVSTKLGPIQINAGARGRVLCSIRPEHLTLQKPTSEQPSEIGTIIGREFKGHDITYHVLLNGEKYLVHTDNRVLFENDDPVVIKPLEPAVILNEND